MSPHDVSDRISEAWLRSTQLAEPHSPQRPRAFSIALSREAGTRSAAIALALSERLNWSVYDHELLEMIARDMNVRVKLLESVDERHVGWLQDTLEAFCLVTSVREGTYVRHLVETLLSLSAHAKCIILGRGSPFVLPASTTLRVRLVAPLEDRLAVVQEERNMSRQDAARYIEQTDRERAAFVRAHFLQDPAEPANYDLILNTGRFSVSECANVIVEALHAKEQASPTEAAA